MRLEVSEPSPIPVAAPRVSREKPLFEGMFLGGFECSCHRMEDGRRLDMTGATRHDELADLDYARARAAGMTACRDGVSWVKVEHQRGAYDFSSAVPLVRAAARHGVTVLWDLMHFGWPDFVDIFSPAFPAQLGRYARAFARWLDGETDAPTWVTPINEMSFLAWAAGDVRLLFPFEKARGVEMKAQLVRATIEAIEAIRDALPATRFLQPEPMIHVVLAADNPKTWRRAECDEALQYQAFDMLTGRVWPSLGGDEKYLDVVGVNFYPNNQFMIDGTTIWLGDGRYRPLSSMLGEVSARYHRPMLLSETGTEGDDRAPWLRYVAGECIAAMRAGCELHGVTLYPAINHPGWADGRHCENGLWDLADASGARAVHAPLLAEMQLQSPRLLAARAAVLGRCAPGTHLRVPPEPPSVEVP
jgi:hypothetical protein